MSAFLRLSARLPITAASAGKRIATSPAFVRFNSSSSTSRAARVIEIAAQVEKPNAMETAVPLMWAATGVLAFAAWNRIDEKSAEGNVEKLLIV